jgi:hypothetical protein
MKFLDEEERNRLAEKYGMEKYKVPEKHHPG